MHNKYFRICCLLLSLVLVVNLLPFQAWAVLRAEDPAAVLASSEQTDVPAEEAHIVHEIEDERTEYSKVYRLSNGLHMAAVYNEPVHYEKDGYWEDIDNTLVTKDGMLRNTAGVWDVSFPQSMSSTNAVTIEKDGYTLSFYMAGQVRKLTAAPIGQDPVSVMAVTASAAQVQTLDMTAEKEAAEHPETVLENTHSRLQYTGVFSNTNVVYDLVSNRVKESIIIGAYDAELQGYQYTLNTGSLTPVLTDSGEILLLGTDKQTVVMTMPAPYLVDNNGEYSYDVTVDLQGAKGTYVLTYTLPTSWMANSSRSYPVVLDPIVSADMNINNIRDVSVYEYHDNGDNNLYVLQLGHDTYYGITRAFLKYSELPPIPDNSVIVGATLKLEKEKDSSFSYPVEVHSVSGSWESETLTWENKPGYGERIQDYTIAQAKGDYYWDVTRIVRGWYQNGNTGLMLKASEDIENTTSSTNYRINFYSSDNSTSHRPTLTILYRSTIGIESYYTYATLGVGNAGGVYIGDSTGQITAVKEVASYASSINPFSLNLVYNSAYFAQDASASYSPVQAMGLPGSMGNGWTLDVIQKIEPMDNNSNYLIYHDGDGTLHYFQKNGTEYLDEDGLGMTVTVSGSTYTMTDTAGNKWFFTSLGLSGVSGSFLTSTLDNNNNGFDIEYSTSGQLEEIYQKNANATDANRILVAKLTWTDGVLTNIQDATGDSYALAYTSGNLTNVSRIYNSDKSYSCGVYSYTGNRLTTMTDDLRDYTLNFHFGLETDEDITPAAVGRVTSYWETANSQTGVTCEIEYPSYTQTVYHSYGIDHIGNNSDDLYTNYLFDFSGRTINAYTTMADRTTVLGASNAVYTENNEADRTNNRTLRTSSIGVPGQKILPRGNFEDEGTTWTYSNTQLVTDFARTGTGSVKGTVTTTADAVVSRGSKTLTIGQKYVVSAYINTKDLTNFQHDADNLEHAAGVYLKVQTGTGAVFYSDPVNYATSEEVDDGWVRISVVFHSTIQKGATIYVVGEGAQGSFYVDDIQLEEGEAPSNYNLLENGDLQTTSFAYGWTLGTGALYYDSGAEGGSYPYTRYIEITGSPTNEAANATQTVNLGHTLDHTYVLSGWAKADAVEDNVMEDEVGQDTKKQFGLRAILTYSDNHKEYFYVPFSPDISEWQYTSMAIVPSYKPTNANVTISTIDVVCAYEGNANVALFDDLSLVCAAAQSYTYDDNGMPIFSESTGLNGQTVTYDSNNNVSKVEVVTGEGENDKITYSYTYDSSFVHRLKTSTNGLITQSLNHDAVGNVITSTLSSNQEGYTQKIVTSSAYTADGNLISSVTDAAGNTTSYGYGDISVSGIASSCDTTSAFYKTFGIPSTITDANDTTAKYVTDTFGRIREIRLENLASLKYTYGKTLLYEIQRTIDDPKDASKDIIQKYHFLYDDFGNTTSIGIGGWNSEEKITLASYEYAAMNGLLTRQTYGNGDKVEFTYDILGRAKTTTYYDENENVDRVLTYVYTGDGQLYSIHDSRTGFLYLYTYDSIGRLIGSSVKNADGEVHMSTRQEYNANNQLVGQHWTVGSTTYSETYTYSTADGALTSYNNALGQTINLEYDALRRISRVDTTTLDRFYEYVDGKESGQTTGLVSRYWYHTASYDDAYYKYSYSYDALGNISSYSQHGTTYTYTYDDQNQLLTQTGGGKTYTYTYDNAGNILTASDGAIPHSYTYGNALWKDQLTAFDNEPITYDASGNPLSYYNGKSYTFTWAEGRNLVSAVQGTNTYTYAYDSNGLRISKTVNGVKHEYLYASGRLLRETYGDVILDFVYDHNGHPFALRYTIDGTTTNYYYITNLQGDVLTMITGQGVVAASYSYDPYGKVLTATGDMANINPLRYRGYYYDAETGFYYLQSRYYDPIICRFINADSCVSTRQGILGNNMFAYCGSNPIDRADISGYAWYDDVWEWITDTVEDVADFVEDAADYVCDTLYQVYYDITEWHFEDRMEANGEHPSYDQVSNDEAWRLLSKDESTYHIDDIGKDELKFVHSDGREAVFNGDTLEPMLDPQYMGTYNYAPIQALPSDPDIGDYLSVGWSYVAHFGADVLPYWLSLKCNTREQFESKVSSLLD